MKYIYLVLIIFSIVSADSSDEIVVQVHNKLREAENAELPLLTWNNKVAEYSKSKIQFLAKNNCKMSHTAGPKNPGYGENLFWSSSTSATIEEAIEGWYKEKENYTVSNHKCKSGKVCGHYTQVVWKDSKELGCARVVCPNKKGVIIGCNYNPPGNYIGENPY